jgi:serine/threonine protein kinase
LTRIPLALKILSRKLPYYEYQLDAQVFAALWRGQLPKRPGPTRNNTHDNDSDDDDWDKVDKKDWDDLDGTIWALITKCLVPNPEDRPSASRIQEFMVDMKAWDSRAGPKGVSGADALRQKSSIEVNLNCVGVLLEQLQVCFLIITANTLPQDVTFLPKLLFLERSICRYSDQEVVAAVAKLNSDDADALTSFWALVCRLLSLPSYIGLT